MKLGYGQLIATIASFVRYWATEELIVGEGTTAMKLYKFTMTGEKYLAVRAGGFSGYITNVSGEVRDCYIVKVENDGPVTSLRKPTKKLPTVKEDS